MSNSLKKEISGSLFMYYKAIEEGDLESLSSLMTKESYLLSLETLGFKRAFKDVHFKNLLEKMDADEAVLDEVQKILSQDLKTQKRESIIQVVSYEQKGEDRVTLHYTQDRHPKKMYYSKKGTRWKIDFKAGRKKEI